MIFQAETQANFFSIELPPRDPAGRTSLHLAAVNGKIDISKKLLECGAKVRLNLVVIVVNNSHAGKMFDVLHLEMRALLTASTRQTHYI